MADEHTRVVISGAGPNGLMLACELALAGIQPVVLDAQPGPSLEPKANGLVGQVVRMLDQRGLYQAFTGDDEPPRRAPCCSTWVAAKRRTRPKSGPIGSISSAPSWLTDRLRRC